MTIHPDILKLDFSLFESYREADPSDELTDAQRAEMVVKLDAATKEGHRIIQTLINDMYAWGDAYSEVGASDTASREAFAINVARVLGLRGYADQP